MTGNSQYFEEQKEVAVKFSTGHGKNLLSALKSLGYPLDRWIKKYASWEKRVSDCAKETTVLDFCVRNCPAEAVAKKHKVRRSALYSWKNRFLGEDYDMEKDTEPSEENSSLKREAGALWQEVKKLRLGHDVLLKAAKRKGHQFALTGKRPW